MAEGRLQKIPFEFQETPRCRPSIRESAGTVIAGVGIRFDPAMKRQAQGLREGNGKCEKWLTDLAAESGGTIFAPTSSDEMFAAWLTCGARNRRRIHRDLPSETASVGREAR
jgi:hypothetical protein